ncbi:MAG: flagellar protein FlgN [Woeseia sp.]
MTVPSPSQANNRIRLERIADDSIGQAHSLEQALQNERYALETRDTPALGATAEAKREIVARLEALESQWQSAMADLPGVSPAGDDGSHDDDPRRQQFMTVVARCKDLNQTNGAIIRLRRQQLKDTLRIVSGSTTETYDPSGVEAAPVSRPALARI